MNPDRRETLQEKLTVTLSPCVWKLNKKSVLHTCEGWLHRWRLPDTSPNCRSSIYITRPCDSARYHWSQIMINNNNSDENGTLALTSDLICRPLCTLWYIQYHNHAWVHLGWGNEGGVGGVKINELQGNITPADIVLTVWRRANAGPPSSLTNAGEAIDPPVNLFSCISSTVSPQRKGTPPHPLRLFPSTNMIPPEGSPQTSFLINACGRWDHPVSAN